MIYRESVIDEQRIPEIKFNDDESSPKLINEIETSFDAWLSPKNMRKSMGKLACSSPQHLRPSLENLRPSQSVRSLYTHRVHESSVELEDESTHCGGKTSKMGRYNSTFNFDIIKRSSKTKLFKAKKIPASHNVPFITYKSTKPLTQCKEVELETKKRSQSRVKECSCTRHAPSCGRTSSIPAKPSKDKSVKIKVEKASVNRYEMFNVSYERLHTQQLEDEPVNVYIDKDEDVYGTLLKYLHNKL